MTVAETEEGRRWAESRIKTLTGGDPIRARFMRQDEFRVSCRSSSLLISGNHKPGLRSVDEAIRRRFHLIPFTVTIPPDERDPDLAEKLKSRMAGDPRLDDRRLPCLAARSASTRRPPCATRPRPISTPRTRSPRGWRNAASRKPPPSKPAAALFNSWSAWATAAGEHVGTRVPLPRRARSARVRAVQAEGRQPRFQRVADHPKAHNPSLERPMRKNPMKSTRVPLLPPASGYRRHARARDNGETGIRWHKWHQPLESGVTPWVFSRARRISTSRQAGPGPTRRRHGSPAARRSTRPTRWRSSSSANGAAAGLRLVVPPELRARFDSQRWKLTQAQWHGGLEDVVREAGRMAKAWRALDAAAEAAGAAPLSPEVWELSLA